MICSDFCILRYRSQYHAMHENSKFSNYLKILCLNRDRMRKRNELKEKKRVDSLRSADPGLLVILEKSLRAMALHALEEYKTRRRELGDFAFSSTASFILYFSPALSSSRPF